ncbi:MAG: transglutaminase domain-containing protein [Quinella sp. 3Q1]|nr:transglutaminase domain-containing protein [Quinella sp. 3Q1]MBR3049957.1 transglutaminase domain-containing protein [Selenomonadaceae bacterium]
MKKFFVTCAAIFILLTSSVEAANAEYILNSAELYPTSTGVAYCDEIVWATLNQITTDDMTTYEKVLACYNYLVDTCSYGDNVLRLDFPEDNGTARAYGMLVGHVGACDDYSCAFAALVRAIGLNCYTVYGQTARANGGYTGHIWCVIAVDGVEYVFDPQIDDNIGAGVYYRFCMTYDETPGSYYDSEVRWGYFEPFY